MPGSSRNRRRRQAAGRRVPPIQRSEPLFPRPGSARGGTPLATTSIKKPSANRGARLAIALSLIPIVYLVWMGVRLHVDIPVGDQSELVPLLEKLDAGSLSFVDLWRQQNEHRPMFPL